MDDRMGKCLEYIKEKVGQKKVLMLLSGGVDSTVCAALMTKALDPDKVIAIHIDNGFMRKGESAKVKESLEKIGLKVHGRTKIIYFQKYGYFLSVMISAKCLRSCSKIMRFANLELASSR